MNHIIGRRGVLCSLAALLLCQACSQLSQLGLGGGGDESGGDIAGQADQFQKYTAYGTMNLLTALSEAGTATGHKEAAAHYAAVADTFKQGSISQDTFKIAEPMIANPDFQPESTATVRTAEGRKHLRDSFIYFSLGAFMDRKASSAAEALLQTKPTAVELANGSVAGAIEVAKVAKNALPTHLATAGKWLAALTAYMKANKMPLPSDAEIKAIGEKEVKDPSLLADFATS